jgi:acyl-CoA synthetase (AMP-forming)/AMP-acid ligase II
MDIIQKLEEVWLDEPKPFMIYNNRELLFKDVLVQPTADFSEIIPGSVVALIGDFDPLSINTFLRLLQKELIVVPLTDFTSKEHEKYFEIACVEYVIEGLEVKKVNPAVTHPLIQSLKDDKKTGLIYFSTGTTGNPKGILHDLDLFLRKFETPRPAKNTINFLLFDHLGGTNTLMHTLLNKGTVVVPQNRTVDEIFHLLEKYQIEILPTTPTFLRMMLMSGEIPHKIPSFLKLITYGSERMDQITLDSLAESLPNVDIRQTYGTSELGVLSVKSENRKSLFFKVGGTGVETKIVDNILHIRTKNGMLGYLNAPSPFDSEGWYNTNDIVEPKDDFFKIIGRKTEIINVGGLKFFPSDIESIALDFPNISFVKIFGKENPITGQHVEMVVQTDKEFSELEKKEYKNYLNSQLQKHQVPKRIKYENLEVGHRFKKL